MSVFDHTAFIQGMQVFLHLLFSDLWRWHQQTHFFNLTNSAPNLKNENNNKQWLYIMLQNLHSETKMHNVVVGPL